MVGRVGKSAYRSETGDAEEGMRTWRKPELQHNWRLAENNNLIHRYWVNFMGVEACRGMFHLFFIIPRFKAFIYHGNAQ
jgi:hypothetical protein